MVQVMLDQEKRRKKPLFCFLKNSQLIKKMSVLIVFVVIFD